MGPPLSPRLSTAFNSLQNSDLYFPQPFFITMTVNMQKEISRALCVKRFSTISTNEDRRNVRIVVTRRLPSTGGQNTPEDAFDNVMGPFWISYIRMLTGTPGP